MQQAVFTARLDLPAGARAVSTARAATRLLLSGWGLTDSDHLDRVDLVTSEIAANAVRHTSGRSALELTLTAVSVTTAVVDSSPEPPTRRVAGDTDGGGRGLVIIGAISDDWGSHPVPGGKRVWARLDPEEAA